MPASEPPDAVAPAPDGLRRFEAIARWRAFGIKHANRAFEDSEAVAKALADIDQALSEHDRRVKIIQSDREMALPEDVGSMLWGKAVRLYLGHEKEEPSMLVARQELGDKMLAAFDDLWAGMGMDRKIEAWKEWAMAADFARLSAWDESECKGDELVWRAKGYVARLERGGAGAFLRHNLPGELDLSGTKRNAVGMGFPAMTEIFGLNFKEAILPAGASGYAPGMGNFFDKDARSDGDRGAFLERLRAAVAAGSGDDTLRAFGREAEGADEIGYGMLQAGALPKLTQEALAKRFAPQAELLRGAWDAAKAESLAQTRQWLENVGAWGFCEKYWGESWSKARFADIETAIAHRAELEMAFEGSQALGAASVYLGGRLGLLPKGDLPQRCFEKLAALGMSKAGWRLLGKLADPRAVLSNHFGSVADLAFEVPASEKLVVDSPAAKSAEVGDQSVGFDSAVSGILGRTGRVMHAEALSLVKHEALHTHLARLRDATGDGAVHAISAESVVGPIVNRFAAIEEEMKAKLSMREQAAPVILCRAASGAALCGASPEAFAEALPKMKSLFDALQSTRLPADALEKHWRQLAAALEPLTAGYLAHRASSAGKADARLERSCDFVRSAEAGSFEALAGLGPKQAWARLGKMEADWHEMVQRRERGERAAISWEPLRTDWPEDRARGLAFKELSDGGALFDEGKELHHCVSSYAEMCQDGSRRILSMSRRGERAGTLELVRNGPVWEMGQFHAHCNAEIEDEAPVELAKASVARACEAQLKLDEQAIKELGGKLAEKRLGKESPTLRNPADIPNDIARPIPTPLAL